MSINQLIIHTFCQRVFALDTPTTYWSGTAGELEDEVKKNWEHKKVGNKPGTWLVPISAANAEVPFRELADGEKAEVEFTLRSKRHPEEGCRISSPRVKGTRSPATVCRAVVFESTTLAKDNTAEKTWNMLPAEEGNVEIIGVEAALTEGEPAHYNTILYDEWAIGGSPSGVQAALLGLEEFIHSLEDIEDANEASMRLEVVRDWVKGISRSHQTWHNRAFIRNE